MQRLKVAVGISGGVDSAVAAWLLKKKGFDVHGVYMVNWDSVEEGTSNCPRTKDEADARRVCEKLDIPFSTVNFVKEYWNEVFVKMLDNYRLGRTVVPDIACNRQIKFEHLHNYAIEHLGADFIATGHYASTSFGDFQEKKGSGRGIQLLCGIDPLKDQTYFLCTLRQEQLRRAIFPVGSLTKTKVRRIAREHGFDEIADKPESMGICFVGKRKDFDRFIDQYIEPNPGEILTMGGKHLGKHEGVHHFTLGKRVHIQGCHLGYFVAKIDAKSNIVYVCEGSYHPSLYTTDFCVLEPQWIERNPLLDRNEATLECRIQRTHPPVPCRVRRINQKFLSVQPILPFRAVADGQMCVFYNGRECLGGGEVQHIISTLSYN
ncbi:putative tRNA (5-methylaminomethyl-2-thiouridylate)-methyltransferase [Oesophagostomum dentatum]|uniref:tRNA-5-taurinomethyluridine 2-sulfurtransferase n=1 Tax=Oesophagostomum dentatum TaxID=61180 RepID=A0A0B1T460_OESDE|nr:putative tRNA (5-methylaminomethyl-2-thiouridylate)-methyltransferase [Oesophagostomum dentatum]